MNQHSNNGKIQTKTQRMVGIALLVAIVVVIQIICTFVHFGPFSITLALAPIIIGAAVYGIGTGAILGAVFGLVVLITGLLGWDGGTVMLLMSLNPVVTVAICVVKGAASGAAAGAVYKLIEKKSRLAAVICAGIVSPIVNTGIFILGMLVFFSSTIAGWAAAWSEGTSLIRYIVLGLCGLNFVVELCTNLVLSSGITSIIQIMSKKSRIN